MGKILDALKLGEGQIPEFDVDGLIDGGTLRDAVGHVPANGKPAGQGGTAGYFGLTGARSAAVISPAVPETEPVPDVPVARDVPVPADVPVAEPFSPPAPPAPAPYSPKLTVAEEPPAQKSPPASMADWVPSGPRTMPLKMAKSAPLLPFGGGPSAAGEQYRIVRTKILQHPLHPRMIVISSPGSGDGKSVSAVNLAGVLSLKTEANVVLIDADFRKASIHQQLGIPEGRGLAEIIKHECLLEDALVSVEQLRNLYVIPAGKHRENPAELLDSSAWLWVSEMLRKSFEYIVIDSPPVAAVADYDLIQAVCDAVILVARPDHTKRALLTKAVESVPKDKFLGVLLNCVDDWFLTRHNHYGAYYPSAK